MASFSSLPDRELLHQLLAYDPREGLLHWKVSRGKVKAGDIAGGVNSNGYLLIKIEGTNYRAHRIAFFMFYGEEPPVVDHIDGNILNNRIANLRAATIKQNQHNRKSRKGSSSKYVGVRWKKQCLKWNAEISVNNRKKHIGYFESEIQAARAYDREAISLYGDFAKLNFISSR